jgi:fibronectin-binding autotransporter adhesin
MQKNMPECLSRFLRRLALAVAFVSLFPLLSSADSFDWRYVASQNWNTPAKSQFSGTCWAHGPTSCVEAKYMLSRNDTSFVPDLSEQQLCWETNPDLGSTQGGGGFVPMMNYYQNHGVVSEADCPVNPSSAYWDKPPAGTPVHPANYADHSWRISSWTHISDNSTDNIKNMLKLYGPIVVGFNADDMFESVDLLKASYYYPNSNSDNHSVSLVGYYDDATCPTGGYWVIKNSWGTSDGENGFRYVPYGSSLEGCGDLYAITGPAYYTGAMAATTWKGGSNPWQSGGNNWTNNADGTTYAWENKETVATFNAATATPVTIGGKVIAHGLIISSGATGYSFAAGTASGSSLTITAGGITANENVTFNTPVYIGGPQAWNVVNAGNTITVNGPLHTIISDLTITGPGSVLIAGPIDGGGVANDSGAKPGGIIKANTGSLTLTGDSNFGGDITVNAGTLTLSPVNSAVYSGAFSGSGALSIVSGTVSIGGGASNFSGPISMAGGTLQFVPASGAVGIFSGKISGSSPIVQNGPGATRLTGANDYSATTTIASGSLQADSGVGLPSASLLCLAGGVLQGINATTFSRSLANSPGADHFYWAAGGGFAAGNYSMIVRINGDTSTLTWGTTQGSQIVGALQLSSASARAVTDFQNAIDLNGDVRTICVEDNPNSTSDYAQVSGNITGAGASGLTKTGSGLLKLTGINNYPGITTVAGGILQVDIGVGGIPANGLLRLDGGVLQLNTTSSFVSNLGTTGPAVQWGLGGGGFSAGASPLTINIGNQTTPSTLAWGSTSADIGTKILGPLTLNTTTASSSLTFKNNLDLNGGARSLFCGAGVVYLTGSITDTAGGASLTKSGAGTLYLNGPGNSYSGSTTILGGDVYLNTSSGYAIPRDLYLGGSTSINVNVIAANQIAPLAILNFVGTSSSARQTVKFLGHDQTVGGLEDNTGMGIVENTHNETNVGPMTLTINTADQCNFTGTLRDTSSGSGTLAVVKTGYGYQWLAGSNISYTGGTTVSQGMLILEDFSSSFGSHPIVNNDTLLLYSVSSPCTFSGPITGTGAVYMYGGNTLTISGSASNTFSGTTTIWGGSVVLAKTAGYAIGGDFTIYDYYTHVIVKKPNQFPATAKVSFTGSDGYLELFGNTVTVGGISAANGGTIENTDAETGCGNGVLVVDNSDTCSFTGTIRNNGGGSGTLSLVKKGTGTLALTSSSCSYTGSTTISGGVLDAVDGSGLPAASLLILDGGVLQSNSFSSITRSIGTGVQWTANGGGFSAGTATMIVNIGGGTALTWGTSVGSQIVGTLKLGSQTATSITMFRNAIDLGGADRTIQVDDNPKSLSDMAMMSGNITNASAIAGLHKTGAGKLSLSGVNSYNGTTTVSAGTLAYSTADAIAPGPYVINGGALDIGANAKSISALQVASGQISGSGTLTCNTPFDVQSGSIAASLAGNVDLVKSTSGTVTLSGKNSYLGNTSILGGALIVACTTASSTGSGKVTVNAGATLMGAGVIGGPVDVAGTLAPGNVRGILTVNNQVAFLAGSNFNVDIAGLTVGSGYDQLKTTGPVTLEGSLAMTFGKFTPTGHDILFLVNNTGLGTTTGTFQYADNAMVGMFDGFNWFVTYDANNIATPTLNGGNDVALYSLPVPEPAALALLAVTLLGLFAFTRRTKNL